MAKAVVSSSVVSNTDPQKFAEDIVREVRTATEKKRSVQSIALHSTVIQGANAWNSQVFQTCVIAWEDADG